VRTLLRSVLCSLNESSSHKQITQCPVQGASLPRQHQAHWHFMWRQKAWQIRQEVVEPQLDAVAGESHLKTWALCFKCFFCPYWSNEYGQYISLWVCTKDPCKKTEAAMWAGMSSGETAPWTFFKIK